MAEEKPKIYRKGIFIPYMGELVLDGYLYKMPFQVDTSKWRTIDTFEEFFDLITDDFILHSHEAEVRRKEKDKFPLKILVSGLAESYSKFTPECWPAGSAKSLEKFLTNMAKPVLPFPDYNPFVSVNPLTDEEIQELPGGRKYLETPVGNKLIYNVKIGLYLTRDYIESTKKTLAEKADSISIKGKNLRTYVLD